MDTQQLLELYKESLESVLTSLENKKYSAETFGKRQELQKKIPGQTDCEDTDYENFVKTSNSVREQLDKYVRKVDDIGLVLKRIWEIRKNHKRKIKTTSITLIPEQEANEFEKYVKALIAMETMMESIREKVDIPVKSPDDATSQAFSQERKETKKYDKPDTSPDDATSQALSHERKEPEKPQQSVDLHKEDSVDEDNKDVVIGDNSNTIEELSKAKNEFDEPREMSETQKEEKDKMIKKLEIECDQLKEKMKDLDEANTSLKDEIERLSKIPESELNDDIRKLTDEKNKIAKENTSLSKELEKQQSECHKLETQVKELEKMNTGLKHEKERYKITYEKEYNKVTEENTAYEQRCKAYENYRSKLEDENKDLNQRYEAYEKYTKTLEDKNSKLKQRLDRHQAPPAVQVKELQKRIDSMTTENESLVKRLKSQGKCTKETEWSEQRSLRPNTAPHSSARHYKELQNQIDTLKAEKESLMQRLSMVAGMKMRDNNPGIADLSDPNRPEKLGEQFREIYDNAWTNLLDYISDNTDTSDDIAVQQIVAVTQEIFEQCQKEVGKVKRLLLRIIGYPEDTFEKQYTGGKAGHDPIVKMVKDLVQISAERTYERVLEKIKEIREIKEILQIGGESADVFLTKCSKLCLFMCVKDPPVVLDFNFKRGDMFDKDKLSAFTTSGDSVGYLVWPVMYLHENGPVMSKGVAQGRKK